MTLGASDADVEIGAPTAVVDFAEFTYRQWRLWLFQEVNIWCRAESPAGRAEAFSPIVVPVNEEEAAPQAIHDAFSWLPGRSQNQLQRALADLISTASADDGRAVTFLLSLAGWVGCRDFYSAAWSFLARPIRVPPWQAPELEASLVFAITQLASQEEARRLTNRLLDRKLLSSDSAAILIAYIADGDASELLEDVTRWCPDLLTREPNTLPLAELFIDELIERFGIVQFTEFLLVNDGIFLGYLAEVACLNRLSVIIADDPKSHIVLVSDEAGDAPAAKLRLSRKELRNKVAMAAMRHAPLARANARFSDETTGDLFDDEPPLLGVEAV